MVKKIGRIALFSVIGFTLLVIIGAVVSSTNSMNKTSNESFGSNPSLSTKTPEINSKTEVTTEKVVIKNTNFIDKGYGLKGIVGEIANTDTAKHTVTLKATFYDTAGKIKGTGIGSVSDLAPAETKTFDIYTSDDITGYATFKVQVDSLF